MEVAHRDRSARELSRTTSRGLLRAARPRQLRRPRSPSRRQAVREARVVERRLAAHRRSHAAKTGRRAVPRRRDLLGRRACRGHDRRALDHRLEHRKPEPLLRARVAERGRSGHDRAALVVGEEAERRARAPVPSHRAARGARRAAVPILVGPTSTSSTSRSAAATSANASSNRGQVLARLDRPDPRDVRASESQLALGRRDRAERGGFARPTRAARPADDPPRSLRRCSRSWSPRTSTPRARAWAFAKTTPRRMNRLPLLVSRVGHRGTRGRAPSRRAARCDGGMIRLVACTTSTGPVAISTCGHRTLCQASYIAARVIGSDAIGTGGVHGDGRRAAMTGRDADDLDVVERVEATRRDRARRPQCLLAPGASTARG